MPVAGRLKQKMRDHAKNKIVDCRYRCGDRSSYGDMLYDPANKQYVAILYHGTADEAALKQYRFRIGVKAD